MPTKQRIIAELTRDELWDIVDNYELMVDDRRRLDHLQAAVRRLTRSELRKLLLELDRDRLKQICRHLELDDGGRLKADIVGRLIPEEEDEPPDSPLPAPGDPPPWRPAEQPPNSPTATAPPEQPLNAPPIHPSEPPVSKPPARPALFIGSTVEALAIARAVHAELDYEIDVTIWNHGLFSPGVTTWEQLAQTTRCYDFALFVFSGDDLLISREAQSIAVRDNLLIEYGLFVGVLGARRTFFLYNRDQRPKIASDLGGVTPLTYRDRPDRNFRSAVSPACDEIRQVVSRLGAAHRER